MQKMKRRQTKMQRKLSVRIIASLILSVMLFALPVGAFIANSSTAVQMIRHQVMMLQIVVLQMKEQIQQLKILRVGIIPVPGMVPTQKTAHLKMNPEMVRLERMIPHRLLNLHPSRNPSVSVIISAASMITTKTAPCAARIIRTANIRSRA